MLYPNGQRTFVTAGTQVSGLLAASGAMNYGGLRGARFNGMANFAKTASKPEGYAPKGAYVLPIKAGGMSGLTRISLSGDGNLLQGGPMEGAGSIGFTADTANLRLIVSMTGTATITMTAPAGLLSLTIGLDGSGSFSLNGTAGLSLIVPFEGSGSWSLTGTGDLRGRLSMEGEWTPFTELSPQGLASAVWGAVAAENNEPGTMGNKVNSAASGGVDLNALAQAVWQYATRTLTASDSGLTPEQSQQLSEIWKIHGLDQLSPLIVTQASRAAGTIEQAITGDGVASTTITRV